MTTRPQADFETTFAMVSEQLQRRIGHKLFTVSHVLPDGLGVERIYTSQPAQYGVGGTKPCDQTEWTAQMERGECFVANHPDQFGPHFFDLSAIVEQGYGAVINVPILDRDRLVGTLNLLDVLGAYGGPVIEACQAVQALAAQGFAEYAQWAAQRSA